MQIASLTNLGDFWSHTRRCFLVALLTAAPLGVADPALPSYDTLREQFQSPDHVKWGEVALWWWEGAPLDKERLAWELQTLAEKGVKAVCPIQRSPARCEPASFSPEWWGMLDFVHARCRELGMDLWAYDQVGYGHYGWLEQAAARASEHPTRRIAFQTEVVEEGETARLSLPPGDVIGARAYPREKGVWLDQESRDISDQVAGSELTWRNPGGRWTVAFSVATPAESFYLNKDATDAFLDMLYGRIEGRLGESAMGRSFAGIFQDEHPPTPRNLHTRELAEIFGERFDYDIARAVPALHFDLGPKTPKYRTDYFDAYLEAIERTYWRPVYKWASDRDMLTSHDNWGRKSIDRQSQGYIDYFRAQRWFSAPGYDDAGRQRLTRRNYYDAKIAASIARLYDRPRVWCEAFHSSGWGRTTGETLNWLSTQYAFGANLYNEHGLYYATRASTWEHAAPDPHWRQPYWRYYGNLSDWVARMSYIMSQGHAMVDTAVHYPVTTVLAGRPPGKEALNHDRYMEVSRALYNAGMDNNIIDDASIRRGTIEDGKLGVGSNRYRALVFGPERTIRRSVVAKALELATDGGTVVFVGRLPSASTERGRSDPRLAELFEELLGRAPDDILDRRVTKRFPDGGLAAFLPTRKHVAGLLSENIDRDFVPTSTNVFMSHRRVGKTDFYLVQSTRHGPLNLRARFRAEGEVAIWDPFTGDVRPIEPARRNDGHTWLEYRLQGNTARLFVFGGSSDSEPHVAPRKAPSEEIALSEKWELSLIPTRDNRRGGFFWPPSEEKIGAEVRQFRYRSEGKKDGAELGWHRAAYDHSGWSTVLYGIGPHWLRLGPLPENADGGRSLVQEPKTIRKGARVRRDGFSGQWRPVAFSKRRGLARPVPWKGHSGYPDGHYDRNFVDLPKGHKLLFTRIRSPRAQHLGLRIMLRNSAAQLWVNGKKEEVVGAVGDLPLEKGVNTVLLEIPDGGRGMLYAQRKPPQKTAEYVEPSLSAASWIWADGGRSVALRKRFVLSDAPDRARVVLTAFTGYRLYVNGEKVAEEIGPWANWQRPEGLDITEHLHAGKNVIGAWGQFYFGQHVNRGDFSKRGVAMAIAASTGDGLVREVVTDGAWKATQEPPSNWEDPDYDVSDWGAAKVRGGMGDKPWGEVPLRNVRDSTEPRRLRSVEPESPLLQCFKEVPDITYDPRPEGAKRVGWYRFEAPPGLKRIVLPTSGEADAWVDGEAARVSEQVVHVPSSPEDVSTVAIRLEMRPGAYAGAAFEEPIELRIGEGTIRPGPWSDYALPTYSGIGVYTQQFELTESQSKKDLRLDLGNVKVAAKVFLNGEPVGVRLARPFRYDLAGPARAGMNKLEVRVANTLAPHYTVPKRSGHIGPTESGLLGPVELVARNP